MELSEIHIPDSSNANTDIKAMKMPHADRVVRWCYRGTWIFAGVVIILMIIFKSASFFLSF